SISNVKRNYASKKYKVSSSNAAQASVKVDQKYEKIAEINTKSTEFDDEEKQAREQVDRYNALIQFEQKSGNKGYRKLNLLIGVPPENFDSLYNDLIHIGKVQAKQITKKDKTNEYKELNAKKASLEKIRNSLIELKTKGGKIEEYMQLENRILEIEQQLQELGVSLGDFDDENEFCTVQFSLQEGKEIKISFIHRVKVALEWTIKFYLRIMAILFFLVGLAYFILLTMDKLKVIERIVNRKE
ncbi:MAG: DUF4349 domain-containing protein, partial [Flavobacteriaceae bacterium]